MQENLSTQKRRQILQTFLWKGISCNSVDSFGFRVTKGSLKHRQWVYSSCVRTYLSNHCVNILYFLSALWKECQLEMLLLMYGLPGGSDVKEPACECQRYIRNVGSIDGSKRPCEGLGSLQCSCLEDPTGRGSTLGYSPGGGKESQTRLSDNTFTPLMSNKAA